MVGRISRVSLPEKVGQAVTTPMWLAILALLCNHVLGQPHQHALR